MVKLFTAFFFISIQSFAQIEYSSKIPKEQLKLLKMFEKKLKNTDFTFSKVIGDTVKYSYADSIKYAMILNDFFDTSEIKNLKEPQTYYMEKEAEETWLKSMTYNGIISMHNLIKCIPDSLFFVMPAKEYNLIEKEDDRIQNNESQLLVVGYRGGGFYYPGFSIRFSSSKPKIIYINLLINFDGYSGAKAVFFDKYLEKIITPCTRTFVENYGNTGADGLPKVTTTLVDTTEVN